jgi:large subunit ribosomal protein L10
MLRLEKEAMVKRLNAIALESQSLVLADYSGLSANKIRVMRAEAREAGVVVRVVRNNLAKLAFASTDYEVAASALVGPVMMFSSANSPSDAAKLVVKFTKDKAFKKLSVKALSIDGKLLEAKELKAVSLLPTKEEALAMLVQTLQSPMMACVKLMAEPSVVLVLALQALAEKKKSTEGV